MSNYQAQVSSYFGDRGVFYIAGLSHLCNSIQAGILLSQLLYWQDRTSHPDGWVYKSVKDLYAETALNRSGQETAIKRLRELGLIDVALMRVPATRHFRVRTDELDLFLYSSLETNKLSVRETTKQLAENPQTITYSTQESNTNSTFDVDEFIEFAKNYNLPP